MDLPHNKDLEVAFVHDWLTTLGGAEKVLEAALEIYPRSPIFTLVYNPDLFADHPIRHREILTSFIDRLPFAQRHYRTYLPFMPYAIEQLDLRNFSVIISSSDAVAHGVIPAPDQLHVNYIHSPMRYAWRLYHQYMEESGLKRGLKGTIAKVVLHYLRLWDLSASSRVDRFVAPSDWVAKAIWRAYRREAAVIYPPVDVERFQPVNPRGDYYITISRLVPYKKIHLIVKAFSEFDLPLVVIGDGPEYDRISREITPNIQLMGWQPDHVAQEMLGRAKAFIHMAEEDFGIAPVEAQAAGCPVIAYGRGGVLETVLPGKTGVYFEDQSVKSLGKAVGEYEDGIYRFDIKDLRANAERFRKERFKGEFAKFVDRAWEEFRDAPKKNQSR
jgi:glycosyltransferase involved in cell wall biosynthesis